ncbi:MAG: 50S ribosomal protein L3 [Oscillospiraceae bacterium]|jgi:large subunit ribosomal protein L3|nr:50S ribosomal protein L3 [Oscillospiraceae bacterium]
MKKAIIGRKIGMTQIFDEKGNVVPITVVEAGPCLVSDKKTIEKNGYSAIQLGFGSPKIKNMRKPQKKYFEKIGVAPKKYLCEFRLENNDYNVGDIIKSDIFEVDEHVDVIGLSKGKGWAGVIKRWNFHRLRESHGTGPVARHGGSIGGCSDPSRVFKGIKSSGRLGGKRITVQNLKIIKIDNDKNIIALRGAAPGPNGSVVYIKNSVKSN